MGNTILAHALYACNQTDLDLLTFFSHTSDAHKIRFYNNTNFVAWHLVEYPKDDCNCVVQIICQGWSEVLRIKMSYSKWFKEFPNLQNFEKFFSYNATPQDQKLWQDFYQQYKDPSWPECPTIEHLDNLPAEIQTEIKSVYQFPSTAVTTEQELVEWLTICYYDSFNKPSRQNFSQAKILQLQSYLDGKFDCLKEVCEQTLNWTWNDVRSLQFHQAAIDANKKYISWLNGIKATAKQVIDNKPFDNEHAAWEQALVIAKICNEIEYDPRGIKWNNIGCIADNNNLYLENFKRTLYGKTL